MPRDLPIGNGHLQINFDQEYNLRDIFFPSVGLENHTAGEVCRTGIWVDGRFFWLSDGSWERRLNYASETLITEVTAHHEELGIWLSFQDAVDMDRNLLVRRLEIRNDRTEARTVRCFFHYDFHIYGTEIGDTVYYDPDPQAIIAYKGRRFFLLCGKRDGKAGVDSWAAGQKEMAGREGTWRDAEDGALSGNPIAQGSVDATIGFHVDLPASGSAHLFHWLAAGTTLEEVLELNGTVQQRGPQTFLARTAGYWQAWVNKEDTAFPGLPAPLVELYKRSLLVIRTQVDSGGAVIASTDWDITSFARDTYCYTWPRDGALVIEALDRAGYAEVSQRFFQFCAKAITREGYLMHKYGPLGDVASSWHPWIDGQGRRQLPIQEDETGVVLAVLWKHFKKWRDIDFITPLYRPLVKNAADFMVNYRFSGLGLPGPSYDLWEERFGIHAFTVAAVWAGLEAAAHFTELFGESDLTQRYKDAADEIKAATARYLFHPEANRFARMARVNPDNSIELDLTLDSSLCGLFLLGMFSATDPLIESTVAALRNRLWCRSPVGGMARYENDPYFRVSQDLGKVPGNPWFISTLWLARYEIARAQSLEGLKPALELLQWVATHALPSGILAEQLHPDDGRPLSVAPLTWSHGEFVNAVLDYLEKQGMLSRAGK